MVTYERDPTYTFYDPLTSQGREVLESDPVPP